MMPEPTDTAMKLSIVTTLYQSAPYIQPFYERIRAVAAQITDDFEIIFVNDGSPDNSLELARDIQRDNDNVTVVDLSRNFGHHHALLSGLRFSSGDVVFMIDIDLEEEPELLKIFHDRHLETGADSIYGVMERRKGGLAERYFGSIFYSLLSLVSVTDAPANTLVARLMTRRFVDSLLLHEEREVDIAGLLHITGYSQVGVLVKKHCKPETTYTFTRKWRLALIAITSFSRSPLIAIAIFGTFMIFITAIVIVMHIFNYFYYGLIPSGFTSIMISLWFLGGLTIFSIGIVALYLSVIFSEVKSRPVAIVRAVYGSQDRQLSDIEPHASKIAASSVKEHNLSS